MIGTASKQFGTFFPGVLKNRFEFSTNQTIAEFADSLETDKKLGSVIVLPDKKTIGGKLFTSSHMQKQKIHYTLI